MSSDCAILNTPPVGEMCHEVGHCYCHLCTCGEHKCPGNYNKNIKYLKSAMRSTYKKEYTKKKSTNAE